MGTTVFNVKTGIRKDMTSVLDPNDLYGSDKDPAPIQTKQFTDLGPAPTWVKL